MTSCKLILHHTSSFTWADSGFTRYKQDKAVVADHISLTSWHFRICPAIQVSAQGFQSLVLCSALLTMLSKGACCVYCTSTFAVEELFAPVPLATVCTDRARCFYCKRHAHCASVVHLVVMCKDVATIGFLPIKLCSTFTYATPASIELLAVDTHWCPLSCFCFFSNA